MRLAITAAALIALGSGAFAQSPADAPTKQEIATAYRSKSGEGGSWVPGTHWERWRIKDIRGWKLRFKRVNGENHAGVLILKYHALAERNKVCAEYQITDVHPVTSPNAQIKPTLAVKASGTRSCR